MKSLAFWACSPSGFDLTAGYVDQQQFQGSDPLQEKWLKSRRRINDLCVYVQRRKRNATSMNDQEHAQVGERIR